MSKQVSYLNKGLREDEILNYNSNSGVTWGRVEFFRWRVDKGITNSSSLPATIMLFFMATVFEKRDFNLFTFIAFNKIIANVRVYPREWSYYLSMQLLSGKEGETNFI